MPFSTNYWEVFFMEQKDLTFIQDQIGYNFRNLDLLQQAFVRRSYAKEQGGEDKEILEIIGDKVLDLVVVKLLTEKYGHFISDYENFDPNKKFDEITCTKNEARKAVCALAYEYLERNNMLFYIQDEIPNPNINDAINQLEILARRGYFSIPFYTFEQEYNTNGNPVWKCTCHITETAIFFSAKSSSKKQAKKQAAYQMLKYILSE